MANPGAAIPALEEKPSTDHRDKEHQDEQEPHDEEPDEPYDPETEQIVVFRAPVRECIKASMMAKSAGQLARKYGYEICSRDNRRASAGSQAEAEEVDSN